MSETRFFYTQHEIEDEINSEKTKSFWAGFVMGVIALVVLEVIIIAFAFL